MPQQQNRNKGQSGSSGRGRGGRGGGGPKCPLCLQDPTRQNNPNALPKDRAACLVCVPDLAIKIVGAKGKEKFEVCISTLENGKVVGDKTVRFSVEGESWQSVSTDANGSTVVPIDYGKKSRTATFLFGSDAQSIEVPSDPDAAKEKELDTTKAPPNRSIVVSATRQRAQVELLVQTCVNGHLVSQPFFYEVDRQEMQIDKTEDGSKRGKPAGTKVLHLSSFAKPRRARFWVVGVTTPVEVVIEPGPGYSQPVAIMPAAEYEITVDVTVLKNKNLLHVLVQTYQDKVQVPMHFCYGVEGEEFKFSCTDDGLIGTGLAGTKVIEILGSTKKRRLTVQLIGTDVDVRDASGEKGVDLPAIPKSFAPGKFDPTKSIWENFLSATKGE